MKTLVVRIRQQARRITSSRFVRNVAAVATGIAAAQAISLACMPILSRIYGPEAFGVLAAFNALVSIMTPVATLGYANAIVMPKEDEDAMAAARLSLTCAAVVTSIAFVIVLFSSAHLAKFAGLEASPEITYLIPFSLLLVALLSVANQMAIRNGYFKAKAGAHVCGNLAMNATKLMGGLLTPNGLFLVAGDHIGKIVNYFVLLVRLPHKHTFELRRWIGLSGIKVAAREHREFALYRMPQSIIYAASLGLPVILLTSMFGAEIAGQYSVTTLILGAPVMLLGQSVMEVLFPKITVAIRDQPHVASRLLMKAVLSTAFLSTVPFGIITIWGDVILPFALGAGWERAGELSRWIAIWMAGVLVAQPAISAMPALKLQRPLLIYEIMITAARVVAIILGAHLGDDLTAIAAFSCVNFSGYLLLIFFVQWHASSLRNPSPCPG